MHENLALKRSPRRRLQAAGVALAIGLLPMLAGATKPQNVTSGELALLPEYCIDTQGFMHGDQYSTNVSPRAGKWVAMMGPTFWHHHHYCWGLIWMQRARQPGIRPELRRGGFTDAVGDFDYVVRNATPDFILLPEVYLRLGEAYAELGNTSAALEAFAASASRKPDYWPAYVNAAQIYERVGLKKQALERIADGLKAAPKDSNLQQHYKRLGGDLAAFMKTLAAPAQVSAGASAPAGGSTPR